MTIERPDIEKIRSIAQSYLEAPQYLQNQASINTSKAGIKLCDWIDHLESQLDTLRTAFEVIEAKEKLTSECWDEDVKKLAALQSELSRLKAELAERDARIGELQAVQDVALNMDQLQEDNPPCEFEHQYVRVVNQHTLSVDVCSKCGTRRTEQLQF